MNNTTPTTKITFSRSPNRQNCERLIVPAFLEEVGVPLGKWTMIYDTIRQVQGRSSDYTEQ